MFLHLSVSHSVHGGVVSQHALQVVSQHALQVSRGNQARTQRGKLRGLARGVSGTSPGGSPGPHLGGLQALTWGVSRPHLGGLLAHTWGGISRPTPGEGSPGPHLGRGLQAAAVRILLECILVMRDFCAILRRSRPDDGKYDKCISLLGISLTFSVCPK